MAVILLKSCIYIGYDKYQEMPYLKQFEIKMHKICKMLPYKLKLFIQKTDSVQLHGKK